MYLVIQQKRHLGNIQRSCGEDQKIFISVELQNNFEAMFTIYMIKLRKRSLITKIQISSAFWSLLEIPFSQVQCCHCYEKIVRKSRHCKPYLVMQTNIHLGNNRWSYNGYQKTFISVVLQRGFQAMSSTRLSKGNVCWSLTFRLGLSAFWISPQKSICEYLFHLAGIVTVSYEKIAGNVPIWKCRQKGS